MTNANIGCRMEWLHCLSCGNITMHDNGNCTKCTSKRNESIKEEKRLKYYSLTLEQKLDYLFERLVIDAIK